MKIFKYIVLVFISLSVLAILLVRAIDLYPSSKSDYTISGIDISHHNEISNWLELREQIKFCIIKATEGGSFIDPRFTTNWVNCRKNKIICGAYHFFTPGISAEKQFSNYKNHVKLISKDLPPILDVELTGFSINEVNKWLDLAYKHYKVKPIVYTDYFFFKLYMEGRIRDCGIWIYINNKYELKPCFNDLECVFWQYNQKGKVKGINGEVDLDVFLGDINSFNKIQID